jgi:hypothetical protein
MRTTLNAMLAAMIAIPMTLMAAGPAMACGGYGDFANWDRDTDFGIELLEWQEGTRPIFVSWNRFLKHIDDVVLREKVASFVVELDKRNLLEADDLRFDSVRAIVVANREARLAEIKALNAELEAELEATNVTADVVEADEPVETVETDVIESGKSEAVEIATASIPAPVGVATADERQPMSPFTGAGLLGLGLVGGILIRRRN